MAVYSVEEIELIRGNNLLVSRTLAEVAKIIAPGVTTNELDKVAETFIRDNGAVPGFLGYRGFPKSLCTSVNSQVVHGIPSDYELQEGDIVSVDCGTYMNGFYGDTAYTFVIGPIPEDVQALLDVTKASLLEAVKLAVSGNRVGDISYSIQSYCEDAGYTVVRELVGHGLGKNMHESPEVPNYGKRGSGSKLKKGSVICIEPMINLGRREIKQESDGWTITTLDKSVSAHFELAVAIGDKEPDVLSTFKYVEEVLEKKG